MSLTAGKYTVGVDLTTKEGKEKLWALLEGADVVLQAFRRRSLERKGFGLNDVLAMANKRGKGIVYMDLTCYGPDGTFSERPGYQQIADAASGVSYVLGKAYGYDEGVAVLPSLPISDMLTGVSGVVGVLIGLRERATSGGSYHIDAALTATNMIQVTEAFGLYPPETVQKLQDTYQYDPMTPELSMDDILHVVVKAWLEHGKAIAKKEYYVNFEESPFGKDHTILAPVVRFGNKSVSPYWKHSPVPYCHSTEVKWSS